MTKLDPNNGPNNGKGRNSGFTNVIASEKHERAAQRSLHEIIVFYQSVAKEMQRMLQDKAKGQAIDMDLFACMENVQKQYKNVIKGFLEKDDNGQRDALITYADAIQDLMKQMHMRKVVQ